VVEGGQGLGFGREPLRIRLAIGMARQGPGGQPRILVDDAAGQFKPGLSFAQTPPSRRRRVLLSAVGQLHELDALARLAQIVPDQLAHGGGRPREGGDEAAFGLRQVARQGGAKVGVVQLVAETHEVDRQPGLFIERGQALRRPIRHGVRLRHCLGTHCR